MTLSVRTNVLTHRRSCETSQVNNGGDIREPGRPWGEHKTTAEIQHDLLTD
jgi:hypothetical protein